MGQVISVRQARANDAVALADILNEIILIGGTTAFEDCFSAEAFSRYFILGDEAVFCCVAVDGDGVLLGFQSLRRETKLPASWADIATFSRASSKVTGVGAALFPATVALAREAGLKTINATIRADNVSGLRYYSKMGFVDYHVWKDVPLKDGLKVDRICKRFDV